MNQNFKCRCKRAVYGLLLFPHFAVGVLLVFLSVFAYITQLIAFKIALYLYISAIIMMIILSFTVCRSKPLTSLFSLCRVPYAGWNVIVQRHLPKMECEAILHILTKETLLLYKSIPCGRYKVITHDTVCNRIEKHTDMFHVSTKKLLGSDNLMSLHKQMRGANCRCCRNNTNRLLCTMIKQNRNFYMIEFEKISSSITAGQFR